MSQFHSEIITRPIPNIKVATEQGNKFYINNFTVYMRLNFYLKELFCVGGSKRLQKSYLKISVFMLVFQWLYCVLRRRAIFSEETYFMKFHVSCKICAGAKKALFKSNIRKASLAFLIFSFEISDWIIENTETSYHCRRAIFDKKL